ncbi:BRO-N domain-containing protein [Ruminococcus sp.]
MNEITIFENPEFGSVRTITIDGEPWLVGKDIALILGYSNPQKAIRDHVDDEDKGMNEMFTPGGKQNLLIINESGFYSLVISSKLPAS